MEVREMGALAEMMKADRQACEQKGVEVVHGLTIYRDFSNPEKPIIKLWRNKQSKPYAHYRFRNIDKAETYIDREKQSAKELAEMKANRKAERSKPHSLKVGDILYSSWGYDQTNVDFWQVVAVRGRAVDIREIAGKMTEDDGGHMSGRCVAVKDAFKGDIIKGKRPRHDNSVPWKSYADMYLWDGRSMYVSWYA
jgi:hypothetical protein